MKINKAIALRISNLLRERKMTKYKLEQLTGLSHATFRNIFNEVNSDIRFSTIVKVAGAFGMTLEEFFSDEIFNLDKLDY